MSCACSMTLTAASTPREPSVTSRPWRRPRDSSRGTDGCSFKEPTTRPRCARRAVGAPFIRERLLEGGQGAPPFNNSRRERLLEGGQGEPPFNNARSTTPTIFSVTRSSQGQGPRRPFRGYGWGKYVDGGNPHAAKWTSVIRPHIGVEGTPAKQPRTSAPGFLRALAAGRAGQARLTARKVVLQRRQRAREHVGGSRSQRAALPDNLEHNRRPSAGGQPPQDHAQERDGPGVLPAPARREDGAGGIGWVVVDVESRAGRMTCDDVTGPGGASPVIDRAVARGAP